MGWQLGLRFLGTVVLRLVTTSQFWLGLAGIALVIWVVFCVLRWEEEILRRLAPMAGFLISFGGVLSGLLLAGLFPPSQKWAAWFVGVVFRLFLPVGALAVILAGRPDQSGEVVAIWTAVFYFVLLMVSVIPLSKSLNRLGCI
jgi:hypothetical protein